MNADDVDGARMGIEVLVWLLGAIALIIFLDVLFVVVRARFRRRRKSKLASMAHQIRGPYRRLPRGRR